MLVDLTTKAVLQVDINSEEAFRILCKTLHMEYILMEDLDDYFIKKNEDDENMVCVTENGQEKVVDERGDLFVALCNVAVNMFPNVSFRSADYIYGNN